MKYSSCCDIENGANSDFCHIVYYRVYCPSRVFPVKKYARYHSLFCAYSVFIYLLDISCLFFLTFNLRVSSLCFCYLLYFEAIERLNGDYDPGQTRLNVPSCNISRDQETKRVPN